MKDPCKVLINVGLPKGFKRVAWDDVHETQPVWLWGTCLGEAEAYGPHIVLDKKERTLRNPNETCFIHYPEELLMKEV